MPFNLNDLGDDQSKILQEQGETVTYTPQGGAGTAISGIWEPDRTLPGYYPDGEQDRTLGVLLVSTADVPTPGDRDQFTIGGVVYAVRAVENRRFFVAFQLEAIVQRRVGGDHSRIRREG